MRRVINNVSQVIKSSQEDLRRSLVQPTDSPIAFYGNSIHKVDEAVVAMARDHHRRFLMVFSPIDDGVISHFSGERIGDHGIFARMCPLSADNAAVLRWLFPWTAPRPLRGHPTTVGCGDRLGCATPGHVAALRSFPDVRPVLAQQSVRELHQTRRSYRDVLDAAVYGVFQSGYTGGYGADGDHLKTLPDISQALDAGVTMVTLDLSGAMRHEAARWDAAAVAAAFSELPAAEQSRLMDVYAGRVFHFGGRSLSLDPLALRRCAVIFFPAIDFAAEAAALVRSRRGDACDLEVSIDEADSPTSPAQHLFILKELLHRGVRPTSIALRFPGEFPTAVDYCGDRQEFARDLATHAAIADAYGGYKLSIHSGSDKFAVFPDIGRATGGRFHLKTAGTSWLEALRILARHEKVLFKVLYERAERTFPDASKSYQVKASLDSAPDIASVPPEKYESFLDSPDTRQILHITYGFILGTPSLRPAFDAAMHKYEELYHEALKDHFERHIGLLGARRVR